MKLAVGPAVGSLLARIIAKTHYKRPLHPLELLRDADAKFVTSHSYSEK